MSHRAVQRVLVRMHFDPGFVERLRGVESLDEPDLTARERAWLRGVDPRAFATDPLRRWRALTGLLEEFPASAAVSRLSMNELVQYFSSEPFRSCISDRGSMALAFGQYLLDLVTDAPWRDIVRLEEAVAIARRPVSRARTGLRLAPGVEVLEAGAGTLERYQELHSQFQPQGAVEALANGPLRLPRVAGDGSEWVLIEDRSGTSLSTVSPSLGRLLQAASSGGESLTTIAIELGADDEAEAAELLSDLVADGLLQGNPR